MTGAKIFEKAKCWDLDKKRLGNTGYRTLKSRQKSVCYSGKHLYTSNQGIQFLTRTSKYLKNVPALNNYDTNIRPVRYWNGQYPTPTLIDWRMKSRPVVHF